MSLIPGQANSLRCIIYVRQLIGNLLSGLKDSHSSKLRCSMQSDDCPAIATQNLKTLASPLFEALNRTFNMVMEGVETNGAGCVWDGSDEKGSYSFRRNGIVIGKLLGWKGEIFVGFKESIKAKSIAEALTTIHGGDPKCRQVQGQRFVFVAIPLEGHEAAIAAALIDFLRDPDALLQC